MRSIIVFAAICAATNSLADEFHTVTCTADLINKSSDVVEYTFYNTRSGPTYDWAYDLAEEGVMEKCAKEMILFDLGDTHRCELTSCVRDED